MAAMTSDSTLDTTIPEPSMTAGEVELMTFALNRSRAQFAWKAGGLDSAQLNRTFPPSAMTIGGIIKHLAFVDDWTALRLVAHDMPEPWRSVDWDNDPDYPWHSAADDSPAALYQLWQDAAARCRAAVEEVVAAGGLDQASKFSFNPDWLPNARRLLIDLHDEYARHVGHVDLFREATDGLVGEDPPQG